MRLLHWRVVVAYHSDSVHPASTVRRVVNTHAISVVRCRGFDAAAIPQIHTDWDARETTAGLIQDYYGATVGLLHGTGLTAIEHNTCEDYEIVTPPNR